MDGIGRIINILRLIYREGEAAENKQEENTWDYDLVWVNAKVCYMMN
jgi:hypothetical protein